MAQKKGGLGKGLDALFLDNSVTAEGSTELAITELQPDRSQPRKQFDEDALAELAASIRQHGVLQPILVRPVSDGSYRIVAGERRWRAARLAGLTAVPVTIRELSDQDAMSVALVENLQREDLKPVEEAEGYRRLMQVTGWTQEQVSKQVGRSRPAVANALRLLSLPKNALSLLREGKITTGHAKAILAIADDALRDEVAKKVAETGMTVREAEKLAQKKPKQDTLHMPRSKDSAASEVEIALQNALGVEVRVKYADGRGTLSVDFYSKEQLFEFANRLGGETH